MSQLAVFAADLAAILILVFVLYFPRHRRKDLPVAFLVVNLGVLAVANALSATEASAGLGLGLFGVLSIIRLRSTELDQQEVAYYFAALALGLLGGLEADPTWLAPALMLGVLTALAIGDHPSMFRNYRNQVMTLDVAFTSEAALSAHLEAMLNAKIHKVQIHKVDLVRDTTVLEVRYELRDGESTGSQAPLATTTRS